MTRTPTPKEPGRFMKFDPTVSTGTIIQTLVFIIGVATAYGGYREDQVKQDGRIAMVEALADKDRDSTRESLKKIEGQVADLAKSNQDIKESLAILRGRAAEPGSRK
ncbi:hypothetical protein [Acidovorax sp. Leaf160]|uniref:hypothetical protein n=1 Tax=Acidovorax sp. Leaf160 TaxID=1736280 RepID=UPI0006F820FF|nr:hypothetical protein [Acidovorax sp. Leaf160]KQR55628.1 hypothetical protein ASF94_04280 [Acidovorax sp. Leaf160]